MGSVPKGLEDVSKYPNLVSSLPALEDSAERQFAELIRRGWSQRDLSMLAGGNIIRIMQGAEAVAKKMAQEGKQPSMAKYEKRRDLDPIPWPPGKINGTNPAPQPTGTA